MQDLTQAYKDTTRSQESHDLAAEYAHFLEKLRFQCNESAEYRFDVLDHSCSNLGHVPHTPLNNITHAMYASQTGEYNVLSSSQKRARHSSNTTNRSAKRTRNSAQNAATIVPERGSYTNKYTTSTANVLSNHAPRSSGDVMPPPVLRRHTTEASNEVVGLTGERNNSTQTMASADQSEQTISPDIPNWITEAQMWYADDGSSGTLMGPDFTDLDRVITFEDATFHTFDFTSIQ